MPSVLLSICDSQGVFTCVCVLTSEQPAFYRSKTPKHTPLKHKVFPPVLCIVNMLLVCCVVYVCTLDQWALCFNTYKWSYSAYSDTFVSLGKLGMYDCTCKLIRLYGCHCVKVSVFPLEFFFTSVLFNNKLDDTHSQYGRYYVEQELQAYPEG